MIWWNGVSSDDLHLYVERYPSRKLPVRKTTFYSVPGRTGDYVYQQNAWENYTQAYDIYISAEDRKLPNAMTAITAWLYSANGYAKLEDSYDLDTYRMAVFEGGQDIENYLNRYGKATIEFNCKPQRWLVSGDRWVSLTSHDSSNKLTITNPTGIPSYPFFEFDAEGSLDIYVNSNWFHIIESKNLEYIDCETQEVGSSGLVYNQYSRMWELPSFTIPSGESKIYYSCEDIDYIRFVPRWYTL